MLCTNLFTQTCNLVEEDGTNQLACNIIRKSELQMATGEGLRRCARVLARKAITMNHEQFAAAQQALGMTHHEGSILLDRTLDQIVDPVKHYLHDPMHCLFVDGVCNVSVYLLLEEHISAGQKGIYGELEVFLKEWAYPGRVHGTHLSDIFSAPKKHRDAQHIKCQASDMLSLIPVLAMWCQSVLGFHCSLQHCSVLVVCWEINTAA